MRIDEAPLSAAPESEHKSDAGRDDNSADQDALFEPGGRADRCSRALRCGRGYDREDDKRSGGHGAKSDH
jgi:hypothetical protein